MKTGYNFYKNALIHSRSYGHQIDRTRVSLILVLIFFRTYSLSYAWLMLSLFLIFSISIPRLTTNPPLEHDKAHKRLLLCISPSMLTCNMCVCVLSVVVSACSISLLASFCDFIHCRYCWCWCFSCTFSPQLSRFYLMNTTVSIN